MSLKTLLHGGTGKLGSAIAKLAPQYDIEIIAALGRNDFPENHIDLCDLVIDTSVHTASTVLAGYCSQQNKPLIIGTTGHTESELDVIKSLSRNIPILLAPNFSIAVNLLIHLTGLTARHLDDSFETEIIEIHHSKKKDAPSGTAKALAKAIINARQISDPNIVHGRSGISTGRPAHQIGIHSLRSGDNVGEHTVVFSGSGERLELAHKSTDRQIFAHGALKASLWIFQQKPGLYSMQDIFNIQL